MKDNMNIKTNNFVKSLVPIYLSKQLKEIGFDEKCLLVYHKGSGIKNSSNKEESLFIDSEFKNSTALDDLISIPDYELAFDWFRKYGFYFAYRLVFDEPYEKNRYDKPLYIYEIWIDEDSPLLVERFYDYHFGREKLLQKLIEIYKEKWWLQ
jgi:hypothetical protein|nr:MAG TPA: hypothetical protein [Caudoviricetes sp.]